MSFSSYNITSNFDTSTKFRFAISFPGGDRSAAKLAKCVDLKKRTKLSELPIIIKIVIGIFCLLI